MASRENVRRFHFLREIASGGFGSVYLAKVMHADGFSRLAAIKLLHQRWSENTEIAQRMRDEARLLGWLRHRNIVDVIDLTTIGGRVAVVMEYLEAVDLKAVVQHLHGRNEAMSPRAALEAISFVASALDAAYNRPPYQGEKPLRVIHRDIKPSNIMVDESGSVKVLDFGVARADFDTRESHTQELQFGSVDYMPPERLFFEPETAFSDIYSLGASLYEILALEKLGKAKGRPEKHSSFLSDRLNYLRQRCPMPGLSGDAAEALIREMCAYNHEQRPSAADVVQRCRALTRGFETEGLNEWAERVIPPLVKAQREAPKEPNPLTDSVLSEDSLLFTAADIAAMGLDARSADEGVPAEVPRGDDRWRDLAATALAELGSVNDPIQAPIPPDEGDDVAATRIASIEDLRGQRPAELLPSPRTTGVIDPAAARAALGANPSSSTPSVTLNQPFVPAKGPGPVGASPDAAPSTVGRPQVAPPPSAASLPPSGLLTPVFSGSSAPIAGRSAFPTLAVDELEGVVAAVQAAPAPAPPAAAPLAATPTGAVPLAAAPNGSIGASPNLTLSPDEGEDTARFDTRLMADVSIGAALSPAGPAMPMANIAPVAAGVVAGAAVAAAASANAGNSSAPPPVPSGAAAKGPTTGGAPLPKAAASGSAPAPKPSPSGSVPPAESPAKASGGPISTKPTISAGGAGISRPVPPPTPSASSTEAAFSTDVSTTLPSAPVSPPPRAVSPPSRGFEPLDTVEEADEEPSGGGASMSWLVIGGLAVLMLGTLVVGGAGAAWYFVWGPGAGATATQSTTAAAPTAPAAQPGATPPPSTSPPAPVSNAPIRFVSAAAETRRITAVCDGVTVSGAAEVGVTEATAASCTITVMLADRTRLNASVPGVEAGTYQCFAEGRRECVKAAP